MVNVDGKKPRMKFSTTVHMLPKVVWPCSPHLFIDHDVTFFWNNKPVIFTPANDKMISSTPPADLACNQKIARA
jgi:hypothetical protein